LQGVLCLHRKYDNSRNRSLTDISDINVCLEPVGYGWSEVWYFLKDFPGMGAIILLTTEMVCKIISKIHAFPFSFSCNFFLQIWNIEHLGLRELFVFMLEKPGKALLAVDVEESVVDYVFCKL
jgi:hypothetical protein